MIRLLIVDDHAMFRAGLRRILEDEPDIVVAGEAASVDQGLRYAGEIDVVLLDIALQDRNGLDELKSLKWKHPSLPVLLVSMYPENPYAIQGFRLGAAGYVVKNSDPEKLTEAVRKVASGGHYISAELTETLISELDRDAARLPHTRLSSREFRVFLALAKGMSNTEIAMELYLSVKTITTYRSRVMEKMGMEKNAELTIYAMENHLL